jgi:hypothetical protein
MECILKPCGDKGGPTVQLRKKGLETLVKCSVIRKDGLDQELRNNDNVTVHVECRKRYSRRPEPSKEQNLSKRNCRTSVFDFKSQCFFCERICDRFPTKRVNSAKGHWSLVETLSLILNVREFSTKRGDCSWAKDVERRLACVIDLVAVGGRYHHYCYSRYQVPGSSRPGDETASWGGSRTSDEDHAAFRELCSYIENNEECQFTVSDLLVKLSNINPAAGPKTEKQLKEKLKVQYGDNITVTEVRGKKTVVCFKAFSDKILCDKWYKDRKDDPNEEKKRVIRAAASIILEDIRGKPYDCTVYPSTEGIESSKDCIPGYLSLLIDAIVKPNIKQKDDVALTRKSIAIQHSIMSTVRPRSFLSSLGIGLSVHLHRRYGSKILIDTLHNLGMCASYKEAVKYESSVTLNAQATINPDSYLQLVFDNADHNLNTIDGRNTFHAMGGIQCVTPATGITLSDKIPRSPVAPLASHSGSVGLRPVTFYKPPPVSGYSKITIEDLSSLKLKPDNALLFQGLDIIWAACTEINVNAPGWNGFMEQANRNVKLYDVSAVNPLPFVNLNPSNPSAIYTCLLYAAEECIRHGQSHVMVTFDQPLYLKAAEICLAAEPESNLSKVVVRLGGFHLLLSFMGSIGYIMAGSGLQELWEGIYAKNSVIHMLNGRAYSRGLRAHLITYQALATLVLELCELDESFKNEIQVVSQEILDCHLNVRDGELHDVVKNLRVVFLDQLNKLSASGRTGKLWVQYMKMVHIIMLFIRAERSGDWDLHLYSVQQMLPFFHAAGHLNYARSAHIYLQSMLRLKDTLPDDEYKRFTQGYFTIRRSDKFWSGIWSDMAIEQILMRAMKTVGGLTTGRGLNPSTIARWVHTTPYTSRITEQIEMFCGVHCTTSDQHVDLRDSRRARDQHDIHILVEWLHLHNPFQRPSPLLTSISSGVVADNSINCDQAEEVGMSSMQKVIGKTFSSVTLHRKDSVKTLSHMTKVIKVHENEIAVNPNQLFHRIVCVLRSDEELASFLQYELSPRPPSLFDEVSIRKGNKASLVPLLEQYGPAEDQVPDGAYYTIDGGYLIHQIIWIHHGTYRQVCNQYVGFVRSTYGQCSIIFDGYEETSTKDSEHLRRTGSFASVDMIVEDDLLVPTCQKEFLANPTNKSRFIALLTEHLTAAGCQVSQATSDADTLIVSTALSIAQTKTSVLVGQDTDLLVLLISFATRKVFMLIPAKGNKPDRIFNIKKMQEGLGDLRPLLLLLHAFTGCDTTSAIFNKGKKGAWKKLQDDAGLRESVGVFNADNSSQDEIALAGEYFFLKIYGVSREVTDLNIARHRIYIRTIAKQRLTANFKLASLPPTKAAALQHSLRVYHQIQQWKGVNLPATDWGWKLSASQGLVPVTTLKQPAPQNLLNLICCNCKGNCEKYCLCRRSSLACSQMCGQCAGIGCSNTLPVTEDEFEDLLS